MKINLKKQELNQMRTFSTPQLKNKVKSKKNIIKKINVLNIKMLIFNKVQQTFKNQSRFCFINKVYLLLNRHYLKILINSKIINKVLTFSSYWFR